MKFFNFILIYKKKINKNYLKYIKIFIVLKKQVRKMALQEV